MRNSTIEALESRVFLSGTAVDPVLAWNQVALETIRVQTQYPGPTWASRNMAIVQAAVFDAVDAIVGGYQPYLVSVPAAAGKRLSLEAAIAGAAYGTLVGLYPQQKAGLQAALATALSGIADGPAESKGLALGQYVASRYLSARANDGANQDVPYPQKDAPGYWQPTPPNYAPPLGTAWPYVTPFVIQSSSQFLPPAPPDLTSAQYTAAFNEVKSLGAAGSTTRTADQTEIALFWSYDSAAMGTPIVLYNQITAQVAQQQHNSTVENARLFALANLAMADAGISTWDAKYTYDFWRPVTAIRAADTDGNPATIADPNWLPLGFTSGSVTNVTPAFPSYTSGHSAFGGAIFDVLARFYGSDNIHFTATSDELPGVMRSYDSFSQAAQENAASRVYLGVHWNFDDSEGVAAGQAIGDYVFNHALLPTSDQNGPDGPHGDDGCRTGFYGASSRTERAHARDCGRGDHTPCSTGQENGTVPAHSR